MSSKLIGIINMVDRSVEILENERDVDNLKALLHIMKNPFASDGEYYSVDYDNNKSHWCCVHSSMAYDGVEGGLYGYGSSPKEALDDCINSLKKLEEKCKKLTKKTTY